MKIVPVFLRYDYGIKARGDSLEYMGFLPALKQITKEVYPFWYDEYLSDKENLQQILRDFIDNIKPDIVFFILMRDEFSFDTLDYLKKKYITVNWFCDDQFRFDDFTKIYAPYFTYAVTTDKFALIKYEGIGYKNVILSQWASYKAVDKFNCKDIKYEHNVSFVGSSSGYRKWLIKMLKKNNINVECFGYGWENGRVTCKQMEHIVKSSRINLNISNSVSYDVRYILSSPRNLKDFIRNKKRIEEIKARVFEIPALGGFQLTNYVPSLEDSFVIGKEIAVYTSSENLLFQIRYYLQNEEVRRNVMLDGYRRTVNEYTYYSRINNILDHIQ